MPQSSENHIESKSFINLGIVINDKGEILMIRRAKEEPSLGAVLKWAFPGGKQKFDESRRECVEREVLAETGYKVSWIREISMRFHPQFPVIVVYHRCQLISQKPIKAAEQPWEVAEVKWVKPKDIRSLITTDLDSKVAKELGI